MVEWFRYGAVKSAAGACSGDAGYTAIVDPLVIEALETQTEVEIVVWTAFVSFSDHDPLTRVIEDLSGPDFIVSSKDSIAAVGLATLDGVAALSHHPDVVGIKLNESN